MVGIIGVVAAVSAEEALQAAGVILLLRGDGLLLGHLDELERRVGVGFPFRVRGHRFVGRGLDPRPCGFLVEPVLLRAERRQLCDLGVPPQLLLVHRSAVLLLHLPVRVKVEDAARALRREHPIRRLLRRLDGVDEISVLGVLDAVGREGVGDAARPLRHRPVLVPQIVPGLVHRGSSTEERPRARCHLCRATRGGRSCLRNLFQEITKSQSWCQWRYRRSARTARSAGAGSWISCRSCAVDARRPFAWTTGTTTDAATSVVRCDVTPMDGR